MRHVFLSNLPIARAWAARQCCRRWRRCVWGGATTTAPTGRSGDRWGAVAAAALVSHPPAAPWPPARPAGPSRVAAAAALTLGGPASAPPLPLPQHRRSPARCSLLVPASPGRRPAAGHRAAAGPCPRRSKRGTASPGFARLIRDNLSFLLLVATSPLFHSLVSAVPLACVFWSRRPPRPAAADPSPRLQSGHRPLSCDPPSWPAGRLVVPPPSRPPRQRRRRRPLFSPPPPPRAQVARRCAVDGTGGSAPCGWRRPPSWPPPSFSGLPFWPPARGPKRRPCSC